MKHFPHKPSKMTFIVYSVESERGRKSENETKQSQRGKREILSNHICRLTIKTTTPMIPHNSCVWFVLSRLHARLQSSTNHLKCILRSYTCTEDDSAPLTIG